MGTSVWVMLAGVMVLPECLASIELRLLPCCQEDGLRVQNGSIQQVFYLKCSISSSGRGGYSQTAAGRSALDSTQSSAQNDV